MKNTIRRNTMSIIGVRSISVWLFFCVLQGIGINLVKWKMVAFRVAKWRDFA